MTENEEREYIKQRINHAKDRIKFWEGQEDLQQIWIGVKVELELLLRRFK